MFALRLCQQRQIEDKIPPTTPDAPNIPNTVGVAPLTEEASSSSSSSLNHDRVIAKLVRMGFDEFSAQQAVHQALGNETLALDILLGGTRSLLSPAHT